MNRKSNLIKDMNEHRKPTNLSYSLLLGEKMFNDRVVFEDIHNDKEYFQNSKHGLRAVVVSMPSQDYISAVEERLLDHKKYAPINEKLYHLRDVYDHKIKVDIPMLAYGSIDKIDDLFLQEGYHRATFALHVEKKEIPVAIRYREEDENIPDYIKEHIDNTQLIIKNSLHVEH